MLENYLQHLENLNNKLKREGIDLNLDFSDGCTHLYEKVTILEQYLYFNDILKSINSRNRISSLLSFDEVALDDFLRDKIFEEYNEEWNKRLLDLTEQPADAGKMDNLQVKVLDRGKIKAFHEFLNLKDSETISGTEFDESELSDVFENGQVDSIYSDGKNIASLLRANLETEDEFDDDDDEEDYPDFGSDEDDLEDSDENDLEDSDEDEFEDDSEDNDDYPDFDSDEEDEFEDDEEDEFEEEEEDYPDFDDEDEFEEEEDDDYPDFDSDEEDEFEDDSEDEDDYPDFEDDSEDEDDYPDFDDDEEEYSEDDDDDYPDFDDEEEDSEEEDSDDDYPDFDDEEDEEESLEEEDDYPDFDDEEEEDSDDDYPDFDDAEEEDSDEDYSFNDEDDDYPDMDDESNDSDYDSYNEDDDEYSDSVLGISPEPFGVSDKPTQAIKTAPPKPRVEVVAGDKTVILINSFINKLLGR